MPSFSRRMKKNRFSRLVADHIQSPKHGGSLVVETGFPTSLIDLYVRNRSRFRKSTVNCNNNKDLEVNSTFSSCSTSDLLSSDLDFRESDEIIIENDVFYDVIGDSCDRNVGVGNSGETGYVGVENSGETGDVGVENSGEIDVEMSVEMGKLNPVMVMVLKVLLMIVLALGTKGFAVGITVSALVLFLLEYLGKSLLVRSSLSADPKTLIESGFNEKKDDESLKNEDVFNEVLEVKEVVDESKQAIRSEESEVVMEIRQKSSRRAIMKSKIKKLVPKKLRKSMGSKDDLASEFKEEESVKRVQGNRPLVLSSECSYSSNEDLCILNQEQDKIEEIESRRSSSSTLSSESDCNVKELGRKSRHNSGYLTLCLIVLVGLIGGRVMAVVLSLSWCLMLKKSQWINCKAFQFLI